MDAPTAQKVIFDPENNYKIRVIEPEQYKETQKLKAGCDQFSTEVNDFMGAVKQFLDFMETQSRRVEDQKLRSIALRNRVQEEVESRKRSQIDIQNVIEAKQKQLEKLNAEIRSWEEYDRQLAENKDKLAMI
ncbi:intraflagellar transport particle protein, putative [Trichomonas vaginalis G3]|uniref:Intraflagellar transport particle protein, putative n=1 Tax=Trichomonas vaginalis (strain ATCC PRA-98 / G3) TaxID=412133 RepID=A2DBR5_TRIV3|nr:intraflagellar transport protein 20-like protein family [Trichomonas vaginalis G3]EAY22268.1 intraflagellar transport particle protein, putative [Trichomonas vaginalis G3]KAI5533262.1 intraflagellar transport protein 20-like protein family [Trichomonas vaginalis G3]|eukprot:XP_001583254.1 intraflagellar transport particle protein [Trichomonas vaginalis G3]